LLNSFGPVDVHSHYMDLAPAMPPVQDTYPVLVSSTTDLPPDSTASDLIVSNSADSTADSQVQLSFLPATATEPVIQTVGPSLKPLPPAIMASIAGLKKASISSRFLTSSHLSRSFNFMGQAFRSARFAGIANQTFYSASVPLRWDTDDNWKAKAKAADINVNLVDVSTQTAQLENNYWSAAWAPQCLPDAQRNLTPGARYRISLGDKTLGYVAEEKSAYLLAQQLRRLVRQGDFEPDAILPGSDSAIASQPANKRTESTFSVGTPNRTLLTIDESMAEELGYSKEWAAVAWANNLRTAMDAEPLTVGDTHAAFQGLAPSDMSMSGDASWYGPYFHGRATANGETYNQNDLTVAHKSLPFGTQLRVRNLSNDKTVVVRVNDRGPYVGDRILDLSRAAADCLGSNEAGVIPVEATVLQKPRQPAIQR